MLLSSDVVSVCIGVFALFNDWLLLMRHWRSVVLIASIIPSALQLSCQSDNESMNSGWATRPLDLADGLRFDFASAPPATAPRTACGHCGDAGLDGSGANRADESLGRFAKRSLFPWCHSLQPTTRLRRQQRQRLSWYPFQWRSPTRGSPGSISGNNRVQLQQVLLNLVVNGMDAMSSEDLIQSGRTGETACCCSIICETVH
jgi:hypothetical protein